MFEEQHALKIGKRGYVNNVPCRLFGAWFKGFCVKLVQDQRKGFCGSSTQLKKHFFCEQNIVNCQRSPAVPCGTLVFYEELQEMVEYGRARMCVCDFQLCLNQNSIQKKSSINIQHKITWNTNKKQKLTMGRQRWKKSFDWQ